MKSLNTKFKIILIASAIVLGLLSSCDVYRMVKCPSYVVFYANLSVLTLRAEPSNSQCILLDGIYDLSKGCGLHSTGAEKERYNQLCQKHNDVSYNRKRMMLGSLDIESETHIDCDFIEIKITADKDFDGTHPAGSNLYDIVRFMSWSPYKYILSGYTQYYHYDPSAVSMEFDNLMRIYTWEGHFDQSAENTCYPIDEPVSNLTTDDLVLLGDGEALSLLGMLYFETKPEVKDEYNITVEIKTDDDRVLTDTIKLTF